MKKCDRAASRPCLRYSYASQQSLMTKRTITISGEQAEVFDDQMSVDRALMEATDDFIAFRPAIEGEWNEQIMLGYDPQRLVCTAEGGGIYPGPYDWTCVVDVGRLTGMTEQASGCRMRFQCPEPSFEELRKALRDAAAERVLSFLALAKQQAGTKAKRPKGFGK